MKKISFLIHPEELSKKWVDRMVECGISILGLHPVGGKDADISLQKTLQLLDTNGFRELIDYAALKGLEIEYEMHAMRYLLPSSEFDKHPEWFRMNAEGLELQIGIFAFPMRKHLNMQQRMQHNWPKSYIEVQRDIIFGWTMPAIRFAIAPNVLKCLHLISS